MAHFIRIKECLFDTGEFIKFWVEGPKSVGPLTDHPIHDWAILGTLRGQEKGVLLAKFNNYEDATNALGSIHQSLTKQQVEKVDVRL